MLLSCIITEARKIGVDAYLELSRLSWMKLLRK